MRRPRKSTNKPSSLKPWVHFLQDILPLLMSQLENGGASLVARDIGQEEEDVGALLVVSPMVSLTLVKCR